MPIPDDEPDAQDLHGRRPAHLASVLRYNAAYPFQSDRQNRWATSRPAFDGTVRRYTLERGSHRYIRFDDTLAEPKPERYFVGPRLLLRELISRQFRLQAVKAQEDFVTKQVHAEHPSI